MDVSNYNYFPPCPAICRPNRPLGGFIAVKNGVKTNFHFVLSFQGERTILIKHNKFKYQLPAKLDTDWIYFSSMAQGTEAFHKELGLLVVLIGTSCVMIAGSLWSPAQARFARLRARYDCIDVGESWLVS